MKNTLSDNPYNTEIDSPHNAQKLLENISAIVQIVNKKGIRFNRRLNEILQVIIAYLGVDQGSIMVLERKKLTVKAATRENLIGYQQSLNEEFIASWVAKNKKPIFIPDISQDNRFNSRNNTYRTKSLLSVPILQNNKLLGVINATDKTGNKDLLQEDTTYLLNLCSFILSSLVQQQLQEKLKRQQRTLRRRNRKLRHQEKLRDELTHMLIHDLKAPLSEVIANLDILSYSIDDKNREFLEAAQESSDRTVRMISNLVSINQMEDKKMKLYKEETEIVPLMNESLSSIKGLAQIRGVTLHLFLPKKGLPLIHIDRILILRIIQNLMINALNNSKADMKIHIGCSLIENNAIEFYIKDQGSGINVEQQQSIFDKYTSLSHEKNVLKGSGLGLYFCKLAIDMHQGTIGVCSSPGTGSKFFFRLPL